MITHLIELRRRLFISCITVVCIFAMLYVKATALYEVFSQPFLDALNEQGHMVTIDVTASFFAPIKLALMIAIILSVPVILYQIWSFIAPALYKKEKKLPSY